jgi:hypothetical protein
MRCRLIAAALDPIGGLLGVREFPASTAGYALYRFRTRRRHYALLLGRMRSDRAGGETQTAIFPQRERSDAVFVWDRRSIVTLSPSTRRW